MKYIVKTAVLILLMGIGYADVDEVAPGYFVAGVQSSEFQFAAAPDVGGRQRQSNWCWAACGQMVLNNHGLRVTQEQVVQRIFGESVNAPGQPAQILAALSGWA